MEKIKIGYFADGPWSHKAFEIIADDNRIEIAFVVPRFDTQDETLLRYTEEFGIDYFKLNNVNSVHSLERISSYECDILVSMSFNQIFREDILNLTPLGIINCHAGKLPFYRGRNILNWALINDEKEFGITVHFVDEGIDTGDIILQRTFCITDKDNYGTLLQIAYGECANILYDSIKLFLDEKVNRIPQKLIDPIGMYCGRRSEGDEKITWQDSSRNIFNFIRAICDPGPQARTILNGKEIKINKARFIQEAPCYIGKPGQILSKTKNGYLVKTQNSFIEIMEVNTKLKVGEVLT
ncbi:methionyl-tRNA formyltransferase [Gramella jeungdoensis]|uniref:Methionyl-tRNA formyltransferase n=1 Tax=Gramella jeungdoensis TaxID=708091 RepID=A0ABT0Z5Q8_9FLAO|nr:methionyl-tRNA formyltransferase [Gramella jeungdoensis]MCM8570492.1 methionyl-tRNA formyltransferase [Gramella jeungdoensis]